MSSTGWTPRIVPYGADQTVYLVVDRFGQLGSVYRQTEVEHTDLATIIADLMSGQFNDPLRVKHACKTGLEGVVSKVRDSQYVSGRVNDWVKKTCAQRETLAIAGFALARPKGRGMIYAGKVDHGFNSASAKDLQTRLKPLIRKTPPYSKKVAHKGIWVEPSLLAEIEYRAKSAEGKVRHPFFKGIREDL
jgi:bifunctional non-homologous end joining protein LigD